MDNDQDNHQLDLLLPECEPPVVEVSLEQFERLSFP